MHASVGIGLVDATKRPSHVGHFSMNGITDCVMTVVVMFAVVRFAILGWMIAMLAIPVIVGLVIVIVIGFLMLMIAVLALLMFAITRFLGLQERGTSKTQGEGDSPHSS